MNTPDAAPSATFKTRLKDPKAWTKSLKNVALWFMGCTLLFQVVKQVSPGYVIFVTTPSIPQGVYWLDTGVKQFQTGDYVNFDFQPIQPWLSSRYSQKGYTFTKQVLGVEGDVLRANEQGALTLCKPASAELANERCVSAGAVLAEDSKGRPLYAWLEPGKSYTLQANELWVYGPHPRSLDSRYYGPVYAGAMKGKAAPWLLTGD